MKFLVLALCVCAASAATFSSFNPSLGKAAAVVTAPVAAAELAYKAAAAVTKPIVQTTYEAGNDAAAAVVSQTSDVSANGFNFKYETQNGISAAATGQEKTDGEKRYVVVEGSYRYYSPDGTPVEVVYRADENGFHAESNVLPVAPAIPEAILRSLEYIARTRVASENQKN